MTPSLHSSPDFLNGFFLSHNLFQSANTQETTRRCTRALGPHRMQVQQPGGGLNSSFNGIVGDGGLAIVRLCHDHDVTIEPQVSDDYIVHHMLSGSGYVQDGSTHFGISPGVITVISPDHATTIGMASNSLNVVVRLPRLKVEEYARNVLRLPLKQPIVFDLQMATNSPIAACWANGVQHVCNQYDTLGRNPDLAPGVETVFLEYLVGLLLQIQPHTYSSRLSLKNVELAPHYITTALDYIHTHLSEHISLAALAIATGVSPRTLQTGFQRSLGQSPMAYLREQRVQQVHQALLAAEPGTRVTDIFLRFGISEFGRYARFYRQRYGVLPSERLKSSQRS